MAGSQRPGALFARREQLSFLLVVLIPTMGAFMLIRVIPIAVTFVNSFFKWSLIDGVGAFIGLRNYLEVVRDPTFYQALSNTMSFTLFATIFSVGLGLFFAYQINKRIRLRSLYETVLFVPVVLTFVPVCLVWLWLLQWDNGFVNLALQAVGLPRVPWLSTPRMSLVSVVIVTTWKMLGYNMIIFAVGLRNIPSVYHEAARIDGGSATQIFRYVTLPQLKPITLFVVVMALINNLQVFTQIYVMTHGKQGSGAQVNVIVTDLYYRGFQYFKMGAGAAESIILLVIVLVLTIIQFRIARE